MDQEQIQEDKFAQEKEERRQRIVKLWRQTIKFQDDKLINFNDRLSNIELDNLKIHNKLNFFDIVIKKEKELRRREMFRSWGIKIILTLMMITLISMGFLPKATMHLLP